MAAAAVAAATELPPAREVPTTFSASFKSWWAAGEKESAAAEERLLRRLPYFQPATKAHLGSPAHAVTASIARVALDKPKHFINTLSFLPTSPRTNAPPATVMLHGYGAGLGFYFKNFESLGQWAAHKGAPVYMIDWLGMGRSARPSFHVRAKRTDTDARVAEAESFFVDSLEEWRVKMGLERMTLVGHSLGGYLATAYALRFPSRVHRLVLLSPAGVPRHPDESVPSQEAQPAPSGRGPAHPPSEDELKALKRAQRAARRQQSTFVKVAYYLWEEGYSPFAVVRNAGFWGPMLVGRYSSRRFANLSEEETRDMHAYIFGITAARGSGEYCISHLLAPGAFARRPLVDRIEGLKIPVTFVYGDNDWMDPAGGEESVKRLRAAGNRESRMYIVPNAGHHVYLDNPEAVNHLLHRSLD